MHSQNHPYKFVLDGGNESVTMWALYVIFPTITIISQHKLILFAGIKCGKQMTSIRALLRIWWIVCAIFVARSTERCVHNLKLNGAFFKDYPRLETSLFFCCLLFRLRTRFSFSFIEFFLLLSFFRGGAALWIRHISLNCGFGDLWPQLILCEMMVETMLNGAYGFYCPLIYMLLHGIGALIVGWLQLERWTSRYWSRMCEPWRIFDRIQEYAHHKTTKCHRCWLIQRSRLHKRTQENCTGEWF